MFFYLIGREATPALTARSKHQSMASVPSYSSTVLLAVLIVLLASDGSAVLQDHATVSDYRTTAADCHNSSSLAICESKVNCTWCQSTLVPSGCYHESEAKFLPSVAFKCDLEPSLPAASPGCLIKTSEEDCSSNEQCTWCSSIFGHTCFSQDQATLLPAGLYQCAEAEGSTSSALTSVDGDGADPGPGASCSGATEEKPCKKQPGCVWCSGSFGPGSCYSEDQAKYLPAQFFKCSKPKKPTESEAIPQAPAAAVESAAAPAPGPAPDCSSSKEKKGCKKDPGCVWCEMKFGSGSCYSEDQAKWLPAQFFKCSKPEPEHNLGGENGDTAEANMDSVAAA